MIRVYRRWWMLAVALLFLFVITACGSEGDDVSGNNENSGEENQQVVVVSWGGNYQAAQKTAMFDPFVEETGIDLIEDSPVNIGKIKSMVQNGNVQWDVVDVLGADVPKLVGDDLLEPIDYNIVSKENMLEAALAEYSVGIDYYSTVLSYNTENLPGGTPPTGWEDFFNLETYPGSRALYKSPITTLEIALLADGVKPENLYPLDVDRAFQKLDEIKSELIWWEEGAQPGQLLSDQEVVFASAWNGRIASAADAGQPLAFTYEQGILDSEAWVVPKGTKNKEAAMKFINFASQPEQQAGLLSEIPYGPTNTKAFDHMDEDYAKTLPTYEENYGKQVVLDVNWWFENFDEVNDRFQAWLLK